MQGGPRGGLGQGGLNQGLTYDHLPCHRTHTHTQNGRKKLTLSCHGWKKKSNLLVYPSPSNSKIRYKLLFCFFLSMCQKPVIIQWLSKCDTRHHDFLGGNQGHRHQPCLKSDLPPTAPAPRRPCPCMSRLTARDFFFLF